MADQWKIDFTHTEGELEGEKRLGIVRISPAALIEICDNAVDISEPRPERFEARPGSGGILLMFQRK
jgi:hypothetical protein